MLRLCVLRVVDEFALALPIDSFLVSPIGRATGPERCWCLQKAFALHNLLVLPCAHSRQQTIPLDSLYRSARPLWINSWCPCFFTLSPFSFRRMNQLAQQQQALLTSSCDVPSQNVYKIASHSLCVIVPFLCSSGISDSGHQTPVRHLHLINLVRHKTQLVPVPKWYDKCIARPWEQFHHLSKIKNLFFFFFFGSFHGYWGAWHWLHFLWIKDLFLCETQPNKQRLGHPRFHEASVHNPHMCASFCKASLCTHLFI